MGLYEIPKGEIGAHEKALSAASEDLVRFADDLDEVEVINLGGVGIWLTVDGSPPAVGSSACVYLPPFPCVRRVASNRAGETTVRLTSAGATSYCVARVSE